MAQRTHTPGQVIAIDVSNEEGDVQTLYVKEGRHAMHYSSRKYATLVEWIACNDNTGGNDSLDDLAGSLTVTMLAHCYKLSAWKVADDVMEIRTAYLRDTAQRKGGKP